MITILNTIASIANKPITESQKEINWLYSISILKNYFTGKEKILNLNSSYLDLTTGTIIEKQNNRKVSINSVIVSDQGIPKAIERYNTNSNVFVIIYNRKYILYMDSSLFNSFIIKYYKQI
jgi:hypothetical protein